MQSVAHDSWNDQISRTNLLQRGKALEPKRLSPSSEDRTYLVVLDHRDHQAHHAEAEVEADAICSCSASLP